MFRGAALAFLLVGAGIGFAGIYVGMNKRAAELVKPLPVLRPRSNSSSSGSSEPATPPPLDTARYQKLQDAVNANPKDIASLTELGNMQAEQNNFEEASKWYALGVKAEPNNIELRNWLGEAQFQANHVDEALATFKGTLAINPSHPEALFDYGYVLLQGKNDAKGAIESWEKLVKDNPNFDQIDRVRQLIDMVKGRTP